MPATLYFTNASCSQAAFLATHVRHQSAQLTLLANTVTKEESVQLQQGATLLSAEG